MRVPDADVAAPESAARVLVIAAREELVVARAVRTLFVSVLAAAEYETS